MPRQRTRFHVAAVLVGLPALLACSLLSQFSATPTPPPTPTPTPPPVIENFDGSPEALDKLNQALLENPGAMLQQAQAYLQSDDIKVRFAAVYALSLAVDESNADALLPALQDPDLRLRTVAAGSLIGLGRKESLPVLIEALGSDAIIPLSEPPRPVWSLAYAGLSYYTGQDLGFQSAAQSDASGSRTAAALAWQQWWNEAGAQLHWDAAAERYVP